MRRPLLAAAALLAAGCADHTPAAPSAAPPPLLDRQGSAAPSAAAGFPSGTLPADVRLVAEGFTSPVTVVEAPDGTGRLFVVDQIGKIWIVGRDGTRLTTPFLDVSAEMHPVRRGYDESGLLGLAFHPRFRENGRLFVVYNRPARLPGYDNVERIAEFHAARGANVADAGSERAVLEIDHPQFNHEGGTLEFGPADGYLYVSLGDGGNKNDIGFGHLPGGNAQNVSQTLLGKVLRLDVDHGMPYAIPRGNPFARSGAGLPEIWAWGFRNPYRFSFDQGRGHRLIAGDVGQSRWEEVDVVRGGRNYGWHIKEGFECFNPAAELTPLASCPGTDAMGNPLVDPTLVVKNAAIGGPIIALVGGNVFRGRSAGALQGMYVFGGFSTSFGAADGRVYATRIGDGGRDDAAADGFVELTFPHAGGHLGEFVKGFGQDRSGEIYVATSSRLGPAGTTGRVYRLVAPGNTEDHDD